MACCTCSITVEWLRCINLMTDQRGRENMKRVAAVTVLLLLTSLPMAEKPVKAQTGCPFQFNCVNCFCAQVGPSCTNPFPRLPNCYNEAGNTFPSLSSLTQHYCNFTGSYCDDELLGQCRRVTGGRWVRIVRLAQRLTISCFSAARQADLGKSGTRKS